jgi:divalent metal cation (Fe/Co/Zn/Cd) transporter
MATGWLEFDPLVAILVALNILWSGGKLIRRSVGGLMDEVDPVVETRLKEFLDQLTARVGLQYHGLRHRSTGNILWVEFHLLFPANTTLASAHALATSVEEDLERQWDGHIEVLTHLETIEDHQRIHSHSHFEQLTDN